MDSTTKREKVIAFDFDGVISEYNGFVSATDKKPPIPGVVDAIKKLKEKGLKVLIYSTRSDEFLRSYCDEYDIPVDYINRRTDLVGGNPDKPIAYVYVDDRTIRYVGQDTETLVREIENFKAYWQK